MFTNSLLSHYLVYHGGSIGRNTSKYTVRQTLKGVIRMGMFKRVGSLSAILDTQLAVTDKPVAISEPPLPGYHMSIISWYVTYHSTSWHLSVLCYTLPMTSLICLTFVYILRFHTLWNLFDTKDQIFRFRFLLTIQLRETIHQQCSRYYLSCICIRLKTTHLKK